MPVDFDFGQILRDPQVEGLLRIMLAGLLSALIGVEREAEGKPAGIRTYGLVGMGSAMFTSVAILGFGPGDYASRVVGQIITGIGFLGAGTILHMRRRVVGLTTAAGMWVAAGVGMAIGSGLYVLGVGAALGLLLILQFVRPEQFVRARRRAEDPQDGEPGSSEDQAKPG